MAGAGAAFIRAGAALTVASGAAAQAKAPLGTIIYAASYGVTADGVTDDTAALNAAIAAAAKGGSTYSQAWFTQVVLPAGDIRITKPIVVSNGLMAVKFRLRGAGVTSTRILADFYTTNAAPQFTVTGGGGSGCVLYPIFYFDGTGKYKLSRVFIANGGTGYTTAPTATLVAATGSGAAVTLTVSGGVVTGVAINAAGSGYPNNYDGDALVVIGSSIEITDLSVISSATRTAASNGGIAAYPYFTTNNGIRYEPMDPGYVPTVTQNRLERVQISHQPGHGINAGRQEQWRVDHVTSYSHGADGLFLHTCGNFTSGAGISNTFIQYRGSNNYSRGLTVYGMAQSTYTDCCVFNNLQGAGAIGYATVTGGAITSIYTGNAGVGIANGTAAVITGPAGGSGAVITPTIVNGSVTGWTINNGGSGYSTTPSGASAATVLLVSVPSASGLPTVSGNSYVNEEVFFSGCSNQNWYGDIELNTGGAAGHDVIRLSASMGCRIGGYWRGGRYGAYNQTARCSTFDSIYHYGNGQDYTSSGIFIDGGTNVNNYLPFIGSYYNAGNVNIATYSTNQFTAVGFVNGAVQFVGMQGSTYAASASSSYTPSPVANGCDQYVTLTGNVTIADTASGHAAGTRMRLIFVQDATGSRSVTFNAVYVGANTGTLAGGAANKIGIMDFHYVNCGGRAVWVETFWSGWL